MREAPGRVLLYTDCHSFRFLSRFGFDRYIEGSGFDKLYSLIFMALKFILGLCLKKNEPFHTIYSLVFQLLLMFRVRKFQYITGYSRELYCLMFFFRRVNFEVIKHDLYYVDGKCKSKSLLDRARHNITKYELNRASRIIVHSEYSRNTLIYVMPSVECKVEILPPMDLSLLTKSPLRDYSKKLHIVFAGRFSYEKGADIFLEVARLLSNHPSFQFTAAGEGTDCLSLIENNIVGLGRLTNKNLLLLLSSASVLLFPSRGDGFGVVQYEALQSGCWVISSEFCGLSCDESNGMKAVVVNESYCYVKKLLSYLDLLS